MNFGRAIFDHGDRRDLRLRTIFDPTSRRLVLTTHTEPVTSSQQHFVWIVAITKKRRRARFHVNSPFSQTFLAEAVSREGNN